MCKLKRYEIPSLHGLGGDQEEMRLMRIMKKSVRPKSGGFVLMGDF
jgi:hypothetical protein